MRKRILAAFAALAVTTTALLSLPVSAQAGVQMAAPAAAGAAPVHIQKPPVQPGEYVHGVPTAATEKAAADRRAGKVPPKALTACPVPGVRTVCFKYAEGYENVTTTFNTGATQVAGLVSQHKPYLNGSDYHTLWETALIDPYDMATGTATRNIIEVGYTVDVGLNGDSNPHIFIYHWVNGQSTCYNGCGWIDNPAETVGAGTQVAVTASGAAPSLYYQYMWERTTQCSGGGVSGSGNGWRGKWTISGTVHTMGAICDTEWTGATPSTTFTAAPKYNIFWEMATANQESCSDEGAGAFGTSTLPSSAADLLAASDNVGGATDWDLVDIAGNPTVAGDTPTAWRVYDYGTAGTPDPDRIRGGGPGYNASGTGTGSIGSC